MNEISSLESELVAAKKAFDKASKYVEVSFDDGLI